MRDFRKFCRPKTTNNPKAGDYLVNLNCGLQVYVEASEFEKVKQFFKNYSIITPSEPTSEYEFIDLGLPSGTLWGVLNVGAEAFLELGEYYAWGETEPKETYSWTNYKYCGNLTSNSLTKYCVNSEFGYNDFTDNKTELESADDVATVNWDSTWTTPTTELVQELLNSTYTTITRATEAGTYGLVITSKINNNVLFLPAAGYAWSTDKTGVGTDGVYWLNSINASYSDDYANYLYFDSEDAEIKSASRSYGYSIRPVKKST